MEEQKQNQFLEALRLVYPDYKFLLLSTMQRGDKMILKVQGKVGSLDTWEYDKGCQMWWDVIRPTAEKLGIVGDIRTLFILSQTEFVLYAPDIGIRGGVFREIKKPVHYNVYGDIWYQYYVGKCLQIDDVITYLQKTKVPF